MKLDTSHVSTIGQVRHLQRIPATFVPDREYPFPANVQCAFCGKRLSRLNSHIVCYACILDIQSSESQARIESARHILEIQRQSKDLTNSREIRRLNHRVAQALRRWHRLRDRPAPYEVLR